MKHSRAVCGIDSLLCSQLEHVLIGPFFLDYLYIAHFESSLSSVLKRHVHAYLAHSARTVLTMDRF